MAEAGNQYARLWRWHFYAGLIIAPVLIIMSVTGGMYLLQPQIEAAVERVRARLAAGGDAALRQQIEAELAALLGQQANAPLEAHERLQFVAIVSETWTIAQGFLTPTMKIKRSVIEAQYQAQFEDWFSKGATVIWSA